MAGWTTDECRRRVAELEHEVRLVRERAEHDLLVVRYELSLAQAELRAAMAENTRLRATCVTAQLSARKLLAEVVRLQTAGRAVHVVEKR